jgi:CheY-like chemotaxis protein
MLKEKNNFIVLYAEDDFEEFDLFREALQRFDRSIELHHARNGVHALESLTSFLPDYIFLDINMPLMDGWECLDHIRNTKRLQQIPVFMISTTRDPDSHRKSIFKGASATFVKAYSEEEWTAIFTEAFREKKQEPENSM